MLVKLALTDEQANRFLDLPITPWYAPAGFNRGRTRVGPVLNVSGEIAFHKEIAIWCHQFLAEQAKPHLDVGLQKYFILFKSEEDLMSFKIRWW